VVLIIILNLGLAVTLNSSDSTMVHAISAPAEHLQRTASDASAKSAYDKSVVFEPHPSIVEFGVHKVSHSLHSDLLIQSSTSSPLYYIACNTLSKDGVDLIVHSVSKDGPILGAAKFTALSTSISFYIGDPRSAGSDKGAVWQSITPPSALAAIFNFSITTASGEPEAFEWRRSHGKDIQEAGGKWFSMRNMTLVRLSDEKVVGVYVDNLFKGLSKTGKIQFKDAGELGEEGQFAALLAVMAINEQVRRHLRGTTGYVAGGKFPI
jgi:hypothetical protein